MTEENVYKRIKDLLAERNWSLYKLADVCGLPRSSLYNMMERNNMPSLPTLDTICNGLRISLSDFFLSISPTSREGYLSDDEVKLLEVRRMLPRDHQDILYAYAKGLYDAMNISKGTAISHDNTDQDSENDNEINA